MIEYDYEIIRDETNETKTYVPKVIPTNLDNLIIIKAPNSSGKSTLLNLIALSLHGNKNNNIHPTLKKEINTLYNSHHQSLKYCMKITNFDNSLEILSKKVNSDKFDIVIHETVDGKSIPLTAELFERKYNLIYDIPDNPTKRLDKLTEEIKNSQTRYGNKVNELHMAIKEIQEEIHKSRNPERLKAFENDRDRLLDANIILGKGIESFENELNSLEIATYKKYELYYSGLLTAANAKLRNIYSKQDDSKKSEKRANSAYEKNTKLLKKSLDHTQEIFTDVTSLLRVLILKHDQYHLQIWERINIPDVYEDLEFDRNLMDELIHFERLLGILQNDIANDESVQEVRLCRDLVSVLELYKSTCVSIPGLEKSIADIVEDLNTCIESNSNSINHEQNCKKAIRLLGELRDEIANIHKSKIFEKIRESRGHLSKSSDSVDFERLNNNISSLKNDSRRHDEKWQYYKLELAKKGTIDQTICEIGQGELEKYSSYLEEQLREQITRLKDKINTDKARMEQNKFNIKNRSIEIEKMKLKKPHKYQNYTNPPLFFVTPTCHVCTKVPNYTGGLVYKKELSKLDLITNSLRARLNTQFNGYIEDILGENRDPNKNMTDEKAHYYESVSLYIGSVLGTINHIHKMYDIQSVDLIHEKIITQEGKTIMFSDVGTGESSSAYLLSLLNNSDDRKIIALFDEISMMDSKSLEPIYNKVKELYNEGKLLVAIFVEKTDGNLNITSL